MTFVNVEIESDYPKITISFLFKSLSFICEQNAKQVKEKF